MIYFLLAKAVTFWLVLSFFYFSRDINRKLYDANDDFYNMFESYPEWLRKEWKVEDIKPASTMIDSRFQRTSTEFKPIKSVVKKFSEHYCEANSSTCISCKNDQTEELRPSSYGKCYCVMSRGEQSDCRCSKVHRNGGNYSILMNQS